MTTGCEGQMFSARMPFSWLLINQINDILKLPHPAKKSEKGKNVSYKKKYFVVMEYLDFELLQS